MFRSFSVHRWERGRFLCFHQKCICNRGWRSCGKLLGQFPSPRMRTLSSGRIQSKQFLHFLGRSRILLVRVSLAKYVCGRSCWELVWRFSPAAAPWPCGPWWEFPSADHHNSCPEPVMFFGIAPHWEDTCLWKQPNKFRLTSAVRSSICRPPDPRVEGTRLSVEQVKGDVKFLELTRYLHQPLYLIKRGGEF